MANANINSIQVTNTFDEWRVATNDLIQDRNILRNKVYVKDESDLQLANGALTLSRSTGGVLLTVTGSGGALVGGTTTTSDLIVQDDASVANTLTVTGNTTVNSNVTVGMNVNVGMELSVSGNVAVNTDKLTVDAFTGDVTLKGDLSLDGGDLVSTPNANVMNTSSNNVNFGGAAEEVRIGSTTGTTLIRNKANITGAANLLFGANVSGNLYAGDSLIVQSNAYFTSNIEVDKSIYVSGLAPSEFKNVSVSNIATIDNAFITTLTLTNPIQSNGTLSNSWSLRMGSSIDGEGFFRIVRSVASGNVDIWWDETENTWKFMEDYPNELKERANLSATLKSVRDFVVNTTATATQTLDLATSNWFRLTVNQNTTFQFANAPMNGVGMTASVLVNQDVSGNHTITWANNVYYENGIVPTPSSNANTEDLWTFTTYDGGDSFIGKLAIKDSHLKTLPNNVEYLVVAGGGGGSTGSYLNGGGGGGGAGGVRVGTGLSISNTTYTITVGAGGAAGFTSNTALLPTVTSNIGTLETLSHMGAKGANSSIVGPAPFSNVIATGGGFGGGSYSLKLNDGSTIPGNNTRTPGIQGDPGGSGGGGGYSSYNWLTSGLEDGDNMPSRPRELPAPNGSFYIVGLQGQPDSPGAPGSSSISMGNAPYDSNIPFSANLWIHFTGNAITYSDNTTPLANARGWIFGYDPNISKFYNYGYRANGGPGNLANTSPAEGFKGGDSGYIITANAHSTAVNNDVGCLTLAPLSFFPHQNAYAQNVHSGLVFANGAYNRWGWNVRVITAGLIGTAGAGGGGGAAEAGFNGANVEIAPPYGGTWTNIIEGPIGSAVNLGPNPIRGTSPTIIAGTQAGGNGGNGIASSITGTSAYYGGGGGGHGANTGGTGGLGGGGDAGNGLFVNYSFYATSGAPWTGNNATAANSAVTNTGGGGGGAVLVAGSGGSGIVVIRYPIRSVNGKIEYLPASNTTGSVTVANTGGYRVYTFTGAGTITF